MAEITPEAGPLRNRWSLALVAGALGALLFYLLQPILSPFVLGALVAYLGDPLVDALERRGLSRTLGVVAVFLVFSLLVALAMILAVPMLLHQLDLLVLHRAVLCAQFERIQADRS